MDRQNWPWRKTSEKVLDSDDSTPVHSIRHLEEHALAKASIKDNTLLLLDEHTINWQQSKEKLQQLNERFSMALVDASAKDELMTQHAKLAEEAVFGWERAEGEALALKQELDSIIQQKLATEDRVSHLDAALKECTCQLRNAREEQEERIHHAIVRNTRELEKARAELEEKLVDMEQKLMDRDAERQVITKLLQERTATISEISESRSHMEAELNVLRVRLESLIKAYDALKLEFVSRNGFDMENLSSKRFVEVSNRQHLEDARKVASLEAECERHRGLLRKASGHHASTYVKVEAERSRDKTYSYKKTIGRGSLSMREKGGVTGLGLTKKEMPNSGKDVDALLERLTAMEDETGRLKELLARRDSDLQHARLMCTRTANKLSSVEEQLEALTREQGGMVPKTLGMAVLDKHVEVARSVTVSCEPSVASGSEDGNSETRSDAWAPALIAELAHFKVQDAGPSQDGVLHQPCLAIEPELSSLSENIEGSSTLECTLAHKVEECLAANQLCDHVSSKLALVEQELVALQAQNSATQRSLQHAQSQLDLIFQTQDDGGDMGTTLDHVREALGVLSRRRKLSEGEAVLGPLTRPVRMDLVARESSSGMGLHEVTRLEEELRRTQGEKVAMGTHMRMEFQRFAGLEEEVAQLRREKLELEQLLELVKEELDRVKTKLNQTEEPESRLRDEETSASSSWQLMEGQLLNLSASKTELESQLKMIIAEKDELQSAVEALDRCLLGKNKRIVELEVKCQEIQPDLLEKPDSICPRCSLVSADGEQASKEQDIAAKLAECQQTILLLGKQVQGFTSSARNGQLPHDQASCEPGPESDEVNHLPIHHHISPHYKASQVRVGEVNPDDNSAVRGGRRRRRARKGQEWGPQHASDKLDSELLSLSRSGRPLGELFGDKTPAHEHYIQALEDLTSSSDNDFSVPTRVEPVLPTRIPMASQLKQMSTQKGPVMLHGADMSRSMDDTLAEKQNSAFARLFSRARIGHT